MQLQAHAFVVLATLLVGGSFIVSQKLSGIIDPISITLFRFVYAWVFLAPFILLVPRFRKKITSSFKRAMVISFFYALFFIGMFKALETTTALNTGTIYTLVPLLTGLISIFVFKQRLTLIQLVTYMVGIVGTCMVVFKGELEAFLALSLNQGDLLFAFAIIFMALYSVSAKYFSREDDQMIVLVFMTLIGGSLWMALAMLFLGIPLEWGKIEGEYFYYLSYLSLATTLLTLYLYHRAIVALGPKKVMAYVYLNPAAIAMLLVVFEGAVLNTLTLLGIAISAFATVILLMRA